MNISNSQILCIGEVLWDCLPSGEKPGGAPLNVAMHLNAIGLNVALASSIGKDEPGDGLIAILEKSGLKTDLIQTDELLPTSKVLVHLDEENNATYEICEPVAWDNVHLTDALSDKAKEAGVLIYGSLASRNKETRETILNLLDNGDTLNLIDVNFRKPYDSKEVVEMLLAKTDIVKLNDDELEVFASWHKQTELNEKELIAWFCNYYKLKMVCVTKGKHGALIYTGDQFYEHPGYKVEVEDTVGAGDAFLAGLVASLLQKKTPEETLAFACATGAFVASKAGATPAYDMNEILAILNQ